MKAGGLLVLGIGLAFSGCVSTRMKPVFGMSRDQSYIDVAPGSRLRVVTPLLRSGGFRVKGNAAPAPSTPGSTLELRADPDFLGYELSWYVFRPGSDIQLQLVEATIDARTVPKTTPAANNLFNTGVKPRFLRLVFLTRSSNADHDMAVLTAGRFEDLEPRTAELKRDPNTACRSAQGCTWIPGGIAVTVQNPTPRP